MILDTLADAARQRVAEAKKQKSLPELRREAEALSKDRAGIFRKALSRPGLNFICEVKKASPSKGLIAPDFPYMDIARQYEAAGAAAISVLTEPTRFLGSDRYLEEIRKAVQTPLLRKDFTVDAYMIYQAKILGADAVLLIAALLSDSQLQAALGADLPLPELGQALMAQALAAGPGDNITLVLIEITALDAETAVPLPQPPAEELSQTRRFEVPAARIAEQETQRKKHAHARRREIILTVAVVLAVLAAVIAALWLAVGSIPRKHPAPASTPVQTVAPTPTPASVNPPQIILPPPPTPEPEPTPEITPEPSPDTTHVPETAAPENLPG